MTAVVKELYHRIESLGDKDRLALKKLLAARLEEEWQAEARKARRIAKQRGITMADVDREIERRRYGT
jgi:hypothetical protein